MTPMLIALALVASILWDLLAMTGCFVFLLLGGMVAGAYLFLASPAGKAFVSGVLKKPEPKSGPQAEAKPKERPAENPVPDDLKVKRGKP